MILQNYLHVILKKHFCLYWCCLRINFPDIIKVTAAHEAVLFKFFYVLINRKRPIDGLPSGNTITICQYQPVPAVEIYFSQQSPGCCDDNTLK